MGNEEDGELTSVTLNIFFSPVVLRVPPFLDDMWMACLNCATARTTFRSLVHMKRPLRFLLGHGLSRTACRGNTSEDDELLKQQLS